jgi:hypothetical protein
MHYDEVAISKVAYELWLAEGCPEGRAERHWTEAKEIVSLKHGFQSTLKPLEETIEEPVEPALAFENLGDIPGRLRDQGDGAAGPSTDNLLDASEIKEVAKRAAPSTRRQGKRQ